MNVTDAAEQFDVLLGSVDTAGAVALIEGVLAAGADVLTVLVDVIAAGQRRIGDRWQHAEWTVAQEHAATAVATAATEVVTRFAEKLPITKGRVLVGCAEREWHALPAALVGTALRADGWAVTQLGAATPAARLSVLLDDLGPDATAVSCSVLGALPATRRFIEASTAGGVPVVVGGAAFGTDDRRAVALGATAWAPGAREAVAVLGTLPAVVSSALPLPADVLTEQQELEMAHAELAARVRSVWTSSAGAPTGERQPLDGFDAAARDAVDLALHAVQAALLTGDPRPVEQTRDWVADVLSWRGGDPAQAAELGRLLAAQLQEYPLAAAVMRTRWLGTGGPAGITEAGVSA